MNDEPKKIVLIGASTRPLIASCLRAGCAPVAFDFFADWDGQRLIGESRCAGASLTKIDSYADLAERDLASLGDAVILAGGAELRSELVGVVGRQLPLLGSNPKSLAQIADPIQWLQVLQAAGCRVPQTSREMPGGNVGRWLVKQLGACGGGGVRAAEKEVESRGDRWLNDGYYQERVDGESLSAVLVSRCQGEGKVFKTCLLGCTRQWLAGDFVEAGSAGGEAVRPFAYRGSVGPIAIPESVQQQVDRIANVLAEKFSLAGVWGLDFILDAQGQVWPVDLNPRITASAELFEAAIVKSLGDFRSVVDLHLSACDTECRRIAEAFDRLGDDRTVVGRAERCEAKRIVFFDGPGDLETDDVMFQQLLSLYQPEFFQNGQAGVSVADVPPLGDRIEAGRPLLTVRSRAKTEAAAVGLLDELFANVRACWRD